MSDYLVVLVDGFGKWEWLLKAAYKRLVEEFGKLGVQMNLEKTQVVNLTQDETFSFLGFDFRRIKTRRGAWGVRVTPRVKARTSLLQKLKEVFRRFLSQPVDRVVDLINPVLGGVGKLFSGWQLQQMLWLYQRLGVKKIRRHLMYASKRHAFGWNRWSRAWLYKTLGLYNDYGVRYHRA